MKTFKNLECLENRLKKGICWDDYFMLNGRMWNVYEYGEGYENDYIYFLNKRTSDMILIDYICPATNYVDGVKVQTAKYRFISVDLLPNNVQWR